MAKSAKEIMKVKELSLKLQEYNPNADVLINGFSIDNFSFDYGHGQGEGSTKRDTEIVDINNEDDCESQ